MTTKRVQLRSDGSMAEVADRDDKREPALVESRWQLGPARRARGCGQNSSFRRTGPPSFQCAACHRQGRVIVGTIFYSTKLGLSHRLFFIHLRSESKNNVAKLRVLRQPR